MPSSSLNIIEGKGTMTKQRAKELFDNLKPDRQRKAIPKDILKRAITEVNKIKKIPFTKASYPDLYWGQNPYKGNALDIKLPLISKEKLIDVPEDFIKKAVFYDEKKAKSQKIEMKKESCVVEHNGEIMIVYITAKTDRAITKATERIPALAEKMDKYYPVKEDTFYTPFKLTKGDATDKEKKEATAFKKKAISEARYTGKNWMDGMIKYFIGLKGSKGGTMISYQPRNPDAENDKEFLFDLIYTYMALYELEKRYAPDVAKYRLQLAKDAGFPGAFPGVPLEYHCSTGVGASMDFASAIHNDSGMSGLTETIIWTKPTKGSKQYFISPTIKMAFNLSDHRAIILQPPKIPHSTLQTGKHQGVGLVNITKQNLVSQTEINKDYYGLWKKKLGITGTGLKNDYVVAIPSYNRPDEIKEKTLNLLLSRKVKPENIFVFVANKQQEKEYLKTIPDIKIVVGKKGIANQRNFMINYFDEGQEIVFMDDDITNMGIKKKSRFGDIKDLNTFFKKSFNKIRDNDMYLWATMNMTNPFYKNIAQDKATIGLLTFSGDVFGIINRKDMKLKHTLKKGEAEQTELSLMYQEKDGGIMLFNNVMVFTGKLTKGGKTDERGSVEDRKKSWADNVKVLASKYKKYIDKIDTPQHSTRAMIKFKSIPTKTISGI